MTSTYDRRGDEMLNVVADEAFAALVQLFIPFPYSDQEKNFKKSLYFFFDRELFAYTDVIRLTYYGEKADEFIYRFATAYFLHCMINKKSLDKRLANLYEMTGLNPDNFLLEELFKAANKCCNEHKVQKWLIGTPYINAKNGKYRVNSFLNVGTRVKEAVFNAARSSRFVLRDRSGHYEYSWRGPRFEEGNTWVEISILYPLDEILSKNMIRKLLQNWWSRMQETFREEFHREHISKLQAKDSDSLAINGNRSSNENHFFISESAYWKFLGLPRKSHVLSERVPSEIELMLFTLSLGENREVYEHLVRLFRIGDSSQKVSDSSSQKVSETDTLKRHLLDYLELGPERYASSIERLRDILEAGSVKALQETYHNVTIPNVPRMVLINIAIDRFSSGLENIRTLRSEKEGVLIEKFLKVFIEKEVRTLRLVSKAEIEMLIARNYPLGARMEDLKMLNEHM